MTQLSSTHLKKVNGGAGDPPGSWTPWGLLYEIGSDLGHHFGHWWYGNESDHRL